VTPKYTDTITPQYCCKTHTAKDYVALQHTFGDPFGINFQPHENTSNSKSGA